MHRTDGSAPAAPTRLWWQLAPAARQLLLTRGLPSVAHGAMTVDFALSLRAPGWSGLGIRALLTGAGLVGGLRGLVVGPLSDRRGRKSFVPVYQVMLAVASLLVLTASGPVLAVASTASASGGAGPFAPAESA